MGCDFFYSGTLPDTELQEKVIEFVQSYYSVIDLVVHPQPEQKYKTIILEEGGRDARRRDEPAYSFDFYGVIPICKNGILEHGQFVFDRTWGGRLVKFSKLPEAYNFPPEDHYNFGLNVDVYIAEGGYNRMLGGGAFALLLNIIRLRWWPDFRLGDDYENCKDLWSMIWEYGLVSKLKNEDLDFTKCLEIFDEEYKRHHPPKPSPPPKPPKPIIRVVDLNILKEPVADLELSVSSLNRLSLAGVNTIGDLVKYSEADLLKLKNFGRKNLSEIKDVLEDFGIYLPNTA